MKSSRTDALVEWGLSAKADHESLSGYAFLIVVHATFCTSVLVVAMAFDGLRMSWVTVFAPVLWTITALLVYFVFKLVRKTPADDERLIFLRVGMVFILVITLASTSLASLVAQGVKVSMTMAVNEALPSIDFSKGTFQKTWARESIFDEKSQDSSLVNVFIKVFEDTEENTIGASSLSDWIGLNTSDVLVKPVFEEALYDHTCSATRDGTPTECPSAASVDITQFPVDTYCSTRTLFHKPQNQTCNSKGEEYQCMLYVYPMTEIEKPDSTLLAQHIVRNMSLPASGPTVCKNTCPYKDDNACDDGGKGSTYDICEFGSDCQDCGDRSWHQYAHERSIFFPVCGFHDKASRFPQKYYAPWAKGQKTECGNGSCYRHSKVIFSEPVGIPPMDNTFESCAKACLIENYLEQQKCTLIQHNNSTGSCERIDFVNKLCNKTQDGQLDCSENLDIFNEVTGEYETVVGPPLSGANGFGFSTRNQWNRLWISPKPKQWTVVDEEWDIYILMPQAFAGDIPGELAINADVQIILAPYICVPLLLGLLIVCSCCTPLNCLPEVRITDPDTCCWDYFFCPGLPTTYPHVHNFRLILTLFALILWQLLLLFRKAVLVDDNMSLSWSIVFAPVWAVLTLAFISIFGLVHRVILMCRNTSVVDLNIVNTPGDDLKFTSKRGRTIITALLFCVSLLLPCAISFILHVVRLDGCSPSRICDLGVLVVISPIFAGLGLNLICFGLYALIVWMVALHNWKLKKLEQFELELCSRMRHEKAQQISALKEEFLNPTTESNQLISILQRIVATGKTLSIGYEEIRDLGHAKLSLLEQEQTSSLWSPTVAKSFGEILHLLISNSSNDNSAISTGMISLDDLGFEGIQGYLYLKFSPTIVKQKMYEFIQKREEKHLQSESPRTLPSRVTSFEITL